jgi:3-methyladenine DNA glycosylase AlkD
MINDEIREKLFANQDIKYQAFQSKLIPNIDSDTVIGVRTPVLRKLAKELIKQYGLSRKTAEDSLGLFLSDLPHKYFEENQLHAFILSEMKDFTQVIELVDEFLPYVDNWATCDQMSIKIFKKHKQELLPYLKRWIEGGRGDVRSPQNEMEKREEEQKQTYTIRFGIVTLMNLYLDDDFKPDYLKWIAEIDSEEYYVNMARAWFFATALAKQYDVTLPFFESRKLDKWTHNKSIQKAIESYRVSKEHKDYLKTLRI